MKLIFTLHYEPSFIKFNPDLRNPQFNNGDCDYLWQQGEE